MHDQDPPFQGARLRALLKQRRAPGKRVWIGVRPEHGAPIQMVDLSVQRTRVSGPRGARVRSC